MDKQSVPFRDADDARSHLTRIGWTNQRFEVDRLDRDGTIRTTWDDQSITLQNGPGFTYERGGPVSGAKISKSAINGKK